MCDLGVTAVTLGEIGEMASLLDPRRNRDEQAAKPGDGHRARIALSLTLVGGAFAATQLPKNSVGSKQIKKKAIKAKHIAKNAVATNRIKASAVDGSRVRDNSLTGDDIDEATLNSVDADRVNGSRVIQISYTARPTRARRSSSRSPG